MYSSSVRGRSPASYWTSSSILEAFTRRSSIIFRGAPQSSDHLAQDAAQHLLERSVRRLLRGRVDRLLGHGAVVTQIDQRRQEIVSDVIASGRRRTRRGRRVRKPILQLEADAFRGLLAHARDFRQ